MTTTATTTATDTDTITTTITTTTTAAPTTPPASSDGPAPDVDAGAPVASASEVVQGIYAAFGRGDMPGLMALIDPDVDWSLQVDAPGAERVAMFRSGRGHAAVERYFGGVAELEFHVFDAHAFHVAGDQVIVELVLDVTHTTTGKRARFDEIHHWIVRDGRVVRYRPFVDTATFIELYRP